MAYEFVYEHHVPQVKPLIDFPFLFNLESAGEDETPDFVVSFSIQEGTQADKIKKTLKEELRTALITHFKFGKYLNRYSADFRNTAAVRLVVHASISTFRYVINEKGKRQAEHTHTAEKNIAITNITSDYEYNLITTLEQLKEAVSGLKSRISFDTETTGLNPEEDHIVGFSFSDDRKKGYYVPVKHNEKFKNVNLGIEALSLIHEAMRKADTVYMFNSIFDMRMMEFSGFDMSTVNVIDVQILTWFADPDFNKNNLKYLEKHFGGFYRPDLSDVLKSNKLNSFDLSVLSPENILFYAGQDAISTFAVGEDTLQFLFEFGLSGKIDHALLYPLMKMENHGIRIDTAYLEEQLSYVLPRLNSLNEKIKEQIGNVNLNSPPQKAALFKKMGLDTDVRTKKAKNMATGTKEVEAMIERLEHEGKDYPDWLKYMGERAKLEKLQSTFFGSLLQQAKLNNGRVRINYRNTQTATGRLSSGEDFGKE